MWYRNTGIEIEFNEKQDFNEDILKEICHKIRFVDDFDNEEFKYWVSKPDFSCGFEINSPILKSEKDLEELKYILTQIKMYCKKNNIRVVDKRCGLHIHIDVLDYEIQHFKNLTLLTQLIEEEIIYSIINVYRINNRFCKSVNYYNIIIGLSNKKKKNFQNKIKVLLERNYGLNIQSYDKYSTVEFRYHHSTLSLIEISFWINLLQSLVEFSKNNSIKEILDLKNLEIKSLLKKLKLDERTIDYILKKRENLKNVRNLLYKKEYIK